MVSQQDVYNKVYNAVYGTVSQKGISFSINVFHDLTAVVQVTVSENNMRASVLVSVKQKDDGQWSVSNNNSTTVVENINSIGTVVSRMVTRIRTLRSKI